MRHGRTLLQGAPFLLSKKQYGVKAMRYTYVFESWTNQPAETARVIDSALERHGRLQGFGLSVGSIELYMKLAPWEVGGDPDGDPWRFRVPSLFNSSWMSDEIVKALKHYPQTNEQGVSFVGVIEGTGISNDDD